MKYASLSVHQQTITSLLCLISVCILQFDSVPVCYYNKNSDKNISFLLFNLKFGLLLCLRMKSLHFFPSYITITIRLKFKLLLTATAIPMNFYCLLFQREEYKNNGLGVFFFISEFPTLKLHTNFM